MESFQLSFEEFGSVDSLDGLTELYFSKGIKFSSEEELLNQIRNDWARARKGAVDDALGKETSLKFPKREVYLGGTRYFIHGIEHLWSLRKFAVAEFNDESTGDEDLWFHEEGLEGFVNIKEKVPIFDHWYLSTLGMFREGFSVGFWVPYALLAGKRIDEEMKYKFLKIPVEATFESYPHYVLLEFMNQSGKYDDNSARSAYQAEFMKAFGRYRNKHIVVGMGHMPQIKYFLEHGVKDNEIVETAQRHASLLTQSKLKYLSAIHFGKAGKTFIGSMGVFIGSLPYTSIFGGILYFTKELLM